MYTDELCFLIDILLSEKESQGVGPIQVDLLDLVKAGAPVDGLKDKMRRLVLAGKYEGAISINKIPILKRRQ